MFYKVLKADGTPYHGGKGRWSLPHGMQPGEWMPEIANVIPCERGYHLCREQDLVLWLGPTIWIAEGRGACVEDEDKVVYGEARLLSRVETWSERTARQFAADCAGHVLPIWEAKHPDDDRPRKAIEAARAHARGEIGAAAGAAARSAAGDAAGDAERAWQTARLMQYLAGEEVRP